ncbi:MAG: hypothetical protein sL5_03030 [Candidatus Mesenet longicola]|uniref:Porin domain-containing protein n=1 Tax=Candidatus Mesenet longicola TaxID=1892558 RepID=A0A8J3HUI8_9RICK|nr:MAG: hypothetical protein sGL2_03500 [Candidatus Mesenet longicola]GHM59310.1 MAG: hypothetical protein sL5_03030 [Candidatus Mesenet longicola]
MRNLYFIVLILYVSYGHNCHATKTIISSEDKYAELEGSTSFSMGHIKNNEERFSDGKNGTILLDSNIGFLYIRKKDSEDNLGAKIKLSTKFTSFKPKPLEINIDEMHIFFATQNRGTMKLGFDDTIGRSIGINTSKMYFGAGGINGRWTDLANLRGFNKADDGSGYDTGGIFWVKPDLYIDYKGLKSLRVSYYSTKIRGVQIGLNYLPKDDDAGYQRIVSGGITYSNCAFKNINYSLSLTGELANENSAKKLNKLQTWNAGLDLQYKNVKYVISYGNIGKSGRKNSPETYYINTGIAYYHNNWRGSFMHFISTRGNNNFLSWSINWEKYLAKNASCYIDFVKFNTQESADSSNSGHVFLVGLKSNF